MARATPGTHPKRACIRCRVIFDPTRVEQVYCTDKPAGNISCWLTTVKQEQRISPAIAYRRHEADHWCCAGCGRVATVAPAGTQEQAISLFPQPRGFGLYMQVDELIHRVPVAIIIAVPHESDDVISMCKPCRKRWYRLLADDLDSSITVEIAHKRDKLPNLELIPDHFL